MEEEEPLFQFNTFVTKLIQNKILKTKITHFKCLGEFRHKNILKQIKKWILIVIFSKFHI